MIWKKQPFSSDLSKLNGNIKRTVLSTATNFNSLRATASNSNQYYCGDNLGIHSGIPSGTWTNNPFSLDVVSMESYSVQILRIYASTGGPKEYRRQTYYSSGDTPYNSWTCIEDALNSKLNTNSGVITVQRTTGNTNSFYKYSKIGNVVTVYIEHHASDATINAWSSLDFPGIPSGFRPIQDIVVPASTDRTGSSGMIFSVFPSGVVRLNCKYNAMTDSSDIARSTVSYAVSF